jgi:hypothetical protein
MVFYAFEHHDGCWGRGAETRRQATSHLLQYGDAHGDMEIVENVFGVGAHVPLEIAQIAGAV